MTIKVWVAFLESESGQLDAPLRKREPEIAHVIDHEIVDALVTDVVTVCGKDGRQYVRQFREPRAAIQCSDCLALLNEADQVDPTA